MAWLHTWTGLPLGWLLYAVFFTGTLSYYLDEVNAWTRPELHRSAPAPQTAERALQTMQQLAPDAESWTLALP
ncbi:PepSY domain-containing protein, partial [Escherichia coli]